MKHVAIYSRVSTLNDTQDGSFETQIEYYKRKINSSPDMVLYDVYGDHGKSGRQIKGRLEFQRMLADCEKGKIDLILTKSISRFARNMLECVSTIRRLIELDVEVIFEKEALSTKAMHSELFLSIFAAVAQAESISIGENKKLADRKRYAMGIPSYHASYGYKKESGGYKWNIVDNEAKRVRLAFFLACRWVPYPEIRQELQKFEDDENTGKVWNQTPLLYMLTNVSYKGDVITNKTYRSDSENGLRCFKNKGQVEQFYIKGHHEPLVSEEIFDIVQLITKNGTLRGYRKKFKDEEISLMNKARILSDNEWKGYDINYGDGENCFKFIQHTEL